MRPSHKAWLGLIGGVTAYEIACPTGETLSEGLDELLEHKRWRYMIMAGIGITALHLTNILPPQVDPYHRATSLKH